MYVVFLPMFFPLQVPLASLTKLVPMPIPYSPLSCFWIITREAGSVARRLRTKTPVTL